MDSEQGPVPTIDFLADHEHNYVRGVANTSWVKFHRVCVDLKSSVGRHGNLDTIVWTSAWCELALTTERVPYGELGDTNGVAGLLVGLKRSHPDVVLTVHLGLDDALEIREEGVDLLASAEIEDFFAKRDRPHWANGPDRRRGWPL